MKTRPVHKDPTAADRLAARLRRKKQSRQRYNRVYNRRRRAEGES